MPTYSLATDKRISSMRKGLPQGVLLFGDVGAGLLSTAKDLAGSHLAGIISPTNVKGEADEAGIVRVSQIRSLYEETRGKSRDERVYIIDNADRMNQTAQNAFLKLLEEPVSHVHFILTAHRKYQLLPTVLSRVELLHIEPVSAEQTKALLDQLKIHDATKRQQLTFLAEGLPAELSRLASDETYFSEQAAIISDARTFISDTKFRRMVVAFSYAQDRARALLLLSYAIKIIRRTLRNHPTDELITLSSRLADAYDTIAANGNVRLQLIATVV